MGIKITSHGHSTFSINIKGIDVVVDPYLAGNNPAAVKSVSEVVADYILQTHGHYDHIDDTVALARATGAQVISNIEIANWINAQGYDNTLALKIGDSHQFPFGRIKMTPAVHSSELPDGSDGGDPGGFLVFAEGGTLYVAGDTDLFSEMTLIGAEGIDVAIIPTGEMVTMDPDDAFTSLNQLKPKNVIPCHYSTWPLIEQDMFAWAERVNRDTPVKAVVLGVEESFDL